jgi:ribosomal protein S18 acetylase RimI-like enzyme
VVYRRYEERDFSILYALEKACFDPPFRFSREYMKRLVASTRTATWIAEDEHHLAGFAVVEFQENSEQKLAYIVTIEVDPNRRGSGVGRELLHRMEESARAANSVFMWLHVDAENTAAIGLYERHGYACKGRQENFYPQGRSALIYTKPLMTQPLLSTAANAADPD